MVTAIKKGGTPPTVMVEDLMKLTVKDLWKEVEDEEDRWGDLKADTLPQLC